MTTREKPQTAHPSAKLGIMSLLLGLAGSLIAYFGLWIESDIAGLIGFSIVGIALLGGLTALFWNITASLRRLR